MTVNLLPWRKSIRQKNKKRLWIESVSLILFVLISSAFWQASHSRILLQQKKQQHLLEQQIANVSVSYATALIEQKQQDAKTEREGFLADKKSNNEELFRILNILVDKMPDDIYLTNIQKKENKLYLSGKSPSHAELADFLQSIEARMHQQPTVTETAHTENQSEEIDFNIAYEILRND